jgi:hypothetical protein
VTLTQSGANTALAGDVRDQAELDGLFGRVSDLGLTLLEARASEDRPDKLPENRSAMRMRLRTDRAGSGLSRKEPTLAMTTEEETATRQVASKGL